MGNARQPMAIKYFLVAILFVLFDVEVIFFYPYAVNFRAPNLFSKKWGLAVNYQNWKSEERNKAKALQVIENVLKIQISAFTILMKHNFVNEEDTIFFNSV